MVTCKTHNLVIWVRIPVPPPLFQGGVKVTHKPHKFMFWVQVPAMRSLKYEILNAKERVCLYDQK